MRYSDTLIEHFRHPRNAGMMRDPDGVGESEYAECMDLARVFLRVREGRIEDVRFQTYGCGPTIAASSAATELIRGAALADVLELVDAQVDAAVGGLPPDRAHAAQVVTAAIRAAARDAAARSGTISPQGD
ncbi:MAG TPA: iron-sulfur cluster assembly scaffold protein [Methylomirabilota bacterium]|nr:iron-sulfur cluster assembly scaffold protein [Methylomirabilota bacterium]